MTSDRPPPRVGLLFEFSAQVYIIFQLTLHFAIYTNPSHRVRLLPILCSRFNWLQFSQLQGIMQGCCDEYLRGRRVWIRDAKWVFHLYKRAC